MALRFHANTASLRVQGNLLDIGRRMGSHFEHLSSGLRIARAADDPAGLGISERMRAQTRSLAVAGRNAQDGISMIRVAESGIGQIGELIAGLHGLTLRAMNGTLTAADRDVLDHEYQALAGEILRLARGTEFNGIDLLSRRNTIGIQIGTNASDVIEVSIPGLAGMGARLDRWTLAVLDSDVVEDGVAGRSRLERMLRRMDLFVSRVSVFEGQLGAAENRLRAALGETRSRQLALTAAESRIRDADHAYEVSGLAREQVLFAGAVAAHAQANVEPERALELLRSAEELTRALAERRAASEAEPSAAGARRGSDGGPLVGADRVLERL